MLLPNRPTNSAAPTSTILATLETSQSPQPNNLTTELVAPMSDIPIPDTSQSPGFPTQSPSIPHNHIPPQSDHQMQTRSKNGIFKPKVTFTAQVHYTTTEPTSYTHASKHSQWYTAMDEEFHALQKQGTWSLVQLPRM